MSPNFTPRWLTPEFPLDSPLLSAYSYSSSCPFKNSPSTFTFVFFRLVLCLSFKHILSSQPSPVFHILIIHSAMCFFQILCSFLSSFPLSSYHLFLLNLLFLIFLPFLLKIFLSIVFVSPFFPCFPFCLFSFFFFLSPHLHLLLFIVGIVFPVSLTSLSFFFACSASFLFSQFGFEVFFFSSTTIYFFMVVIIFLPTS